MMQAQADLHNVDSPPLFLVKNNLHQLNNDLNAMVRFEGLFWKADEVHEGTARSTLIAVCGVLWYVDGSHSTLAEQNCEASWLVHWLPILTSYSYAPPPSILGTDL